MIKAAIVSLLFFACSKQYNEYLTDLRASAGCRDIHSCSSCTSAERCDVTERDPEGWATKRECCPK